MPRTDIIIAIDPDVERSGVAVLHTHTRHIRLSTSPFPDLVEYLQGIRESDQITGTNTLVVVEAGWLNKPNWHLTAKDSPRIAAAKGNAAGRNHETGRKIVEMARHYGLAVKEAKPLRKCWRGKDGKITHGTVPARHQRAGKDILPGRPRRRLARGGVFQFVGDGKKWRKK